MFRTQKFIAVLCFSLIAVSSPAQQKYALLVGINNYYKGPGQLFTVLHGCVNDANAMKAMLINRFGFADTGITTLYDDKATKESITLALLKIAVKCKPGDAVVFYYSGHGVWFYDDGFGTNIADSVNGAMVMSDLYSPNNDFLLTSNTLIKIFNGLVDKKVKVTCFYDCCYSGNIVKQFYSGLPVQKNFNPDITDIFKTSSPKSLSLDEISKAVASAGASNSVALKMRNDHEMMNRQFKDSSLSLLKAYNLKNNIYDNSFMPQVSNNSNSMFLSFSATDGEQKGLEMMDETGNYHGVFTKALLEAIQQSPANTPAFTIYNKLKDIIVAQNFDDEQSASYSCESKDSFRLKSNLIGIQPVNYTDAMLIKCGTPHDAFIPLNAGATEGLAMGNILSAKADQDIKIQIVTLDKEWAVAKILSGNAASIKANDLFTVTDHYTVSAPLIKICIQGNAMNAAAFDKFFQNKIVPLTKLDNYHDYDNFYVTDTSQNIFFNDSAAKADVMAQAFTGGKDQSPFFVFLPIPSYISEPVKTALSKNQNVQLVATPAEADYTLYLNYEKAKNDYVFTFCSFKTGTANKAPFIFTNYMANTPTLPADSRSLQALVTDVYNITFPVTRKVSETWMNLYLRR